MWHNHKEEAGGRAADRGKGRQNKRDLVSSPAQLNPTADCSLPEVHETWLTQTITATSSSYLPSATLRLRAEPEERRRIQWAEDVVDNEGMGKKSSKVCCIYHKPHEPGDSDDSSSSSDSDSDSEPDLSKARKAGSGKGKGKKGHPHNHDQDGDHGCGDGDNGKGKARKPSPNAYERQPKPRGRRDG
ncbi:hypothetical protein K431DRAFT_304040 [Polychaeton citri CBS 116435]|uniref:Type 1 phosphatases regulator n=1 Tax=Polychaeton citri CBS 116435 TaxID=1314669 RepID=A0A9P4Q782_9PEZI|nr:hypothetical protein K431DRAFT_304040 [Polychaeton citri CBS 116435]